MARHPLHAIAPVSIPPNPPDQCNSANPQSRGSDGVAEPMGVFGDALDRDQCRDYVEEPAKSWPQDSGAAAVANASAAWPEGKQRLWIPSHREFRLEMDCRTNGSTRLSCSLNGRVRPTIH